MKTGGDTPTAIVLGGGRSRRYGCDKVTASWGKSTMLDHVLAAIPAERREILLVLRAEQDVDHPRVDRIVRDPADRPAGSLRGVVAGLRCSRSTWNWVLACDLPGLQPALLRHLLTQARENVDAVVPLRQGRPEPLLALYAQRCIGTLEARLADEDLSLRRALDDLRVRWIDESDWRDVDPTGESFVNVNTPIGASGVTRGPNRGASS